MVTKALSRSVQVIALAFVLAGCVATAPKRETSTVPFAPALQGPIALSPIAISNGRADETAGRLLGSNFTRKDGVALPASLDGWILNWHWNGTRVLSPRVWAVSIDDGIGRNSHNLFAKAKGSSGGKFVDALVLCPPVSQPAPNECAIPEQYQFEIDTNRSAYGNQPKNFTSLRAVSESGFNQFRLVTEETKVAAMAQIVKARAEAAERERIESGRRKIAADRARVEETALAKRQAEWATKAPKGTALMCSSGSWLMPVGSTMERVPLSCGFPQLGDRSINLSAMLSMGWRIETQNMLPAPSMDGGVGYSVSLILRKG